MKYKLGILLPTLFCFFVSLFLFCEAGHAKEAPKTKKQINDECLSNFDIEKVLNDERYYAVVQSEAVSLMDYISCRSLLDDKIMSRVPELKNMEKAIPHFDSLVLFRKLITEGRVTPEILKACMAGMGKNVSLKSCRDGMQGFLNHDSSLCGNDNACRAVIARDPSLNKDSAVTIYWIKALDDFDKNACESIAKTQETLVQKEPRVIIRDACLAYTTQDMTHCQKNPGFQKFKEKYCNQYAELESRARGEK